MTDATFSVLITQGATLLTGIAWPVAIFGMLYLLRKHTETLLGIIKTRIFKLTKEGVEFGDIIKSQEHLKLPPQPGTPDIHIPPALGPFMAEAMNGVQATLDNNNPPNREVFLIRLAADYSAALYLERANRIILGSQIKALMYIRDTGPCKTKDLMDLYDIYFGNETLLPRDAWLNYLSRWFLINISGDDITLTAAGMAFIPYIVNQNYPINRPL